MDTEKDRIQELKEKLLGEGNSTISLPHERNLLIKARHYLTGAPQDIARKAVERGGISEKQAYWVACEMVSAGLVEPGKEVEV